MAQFDTDKVRARKKFWALAGQVFIEDEQGNLLAYVKQKLFKLREDITVYSDEAMTVPLLNIKARQIIDFSAAYDVTDVATGQKVGALKRKGFKSIVKDEWILMDSSDTVIAKVTETSMGMAILSKLISLIPQHYQILSNSDQTPLATIDQKFAFFVHKFEADYSLDSAKKIDRRLGIAALIMLLLIEGRQSSSISFG